MIVTTAGPVRRLPVPRGILRWLLRLPINLYRWDVGWLLGERFMLLEHVGRKTGHWHSAVVEVIGHDPASDTYYAASGWHLRSDWYRNILAHPQVRVSTDRRRRLTANAEKLPAAEAGDRLIEYAHAHPWLMEELAEIMGYPNHKTDSEIRAIGGSLPVVGFHIGIWPGPPPGNGR
jgi:deazaflavin-dependent oxidoreductase (nitroreductase family)